MLSAFACPTFIPRRQSVYKPAAFLCSQNAPAASSETLQSKKKLTPPVIFVLGGPGSGKGTQCNLLKQNYDLAQVCVGDLLRREAESGSEVGKGVAEVMQRGEIVPGETTMALLKAELARLVGQCSAVLIDGFPRTMDQAEEFEKLITVCQFVLFFRCEKTVMVERLLNRGLTSGRADDVEEVVVKRLTTYEKKTMPVIEHFRDRGLLREVDAGKGGIEEVYEGTSSVFKEELFI